MKNKPQRIPTYRRQKRKAGDLAFVQLNGCRRYLGRYGTDESRQAYERLIAEWLSAGRELRTAKMQITITELLLQYLRFAQSYYRRPDGTPTTEIANIKLAMKPLRKLYGAAKVSDFGPRALKAVRQEMIAEGGTRGYINHHIGRIKRIFKWGVEEELIEPAVHQALQAVSGLKLGRSAAPEGPGIKPVPDAFVNAVEPFVSRQVWAMIQLQRLSGARAGELVVMRPIDLDTTGRIWLYRPQNHKNAYRGHDRIIYFGPRAQEILKPFLSGCAVDAYVFSPREAEAERHAKLSANRKTPHSCGNRPGTNRKANPRKQAGERYTTDSYRRAIAYACDKAHPLPDDIKQERDDEKKAALVKAWRKEHRWHPHQLRHNAATELRKQFGLEGAQLILGHARADVTQVYAEINQAKALDLAGRIG